MNRLIKKVNVLVEALPYIRTFAGKTVVLEWTNNGCPFVGKHYNSGNMQALQRRHIEPAASGS